MIYNCVYCNYKTDKKNSFVTHLKSKKHLANEKAYLKEYGEIAPGQSEILVKQPNSKRGTNIKSREKVLRESPKESPKELPKKFPTHSQKRSELNSDDQTEDESPPSVVRLLSYRNLDEFYKTVSNSFSQQVRVYAELDFLKLNKPQQEAYDYFKKKYCYLEPELTKELLKDIKMSLVISTFLSEKDSPLDIAG